MTDIWFIAVELIIDFFSITFIGLLVFIPGALITLIIFGEPEQWFRTEKQRYVALIFLLWCLGLYIYSMPWITKSELYL